MTTNSGKPIGRWPEETQASALISDTYDLISGRDITCNAASHNGHSGMADRRLLTGSGRSPSCFGFSEIVSSPRIKNISLYPKGKSGLDLTHLVPTRGAYHDRHERAVGCGGREVATRRARMSVRQRRVVLTSRCWRQRTWRQSLPGRNGGKRAVLRGEHVISRKAIAQGMSDVLRCPVCSCAHFLCTLHTRPRVQRASGIPCALFYKRAGSFQQTSGAMRRENAKRIFTVVPDKRSDERRSLLRIGVSQLSPRDVDMSRRDPRRGVLDAAAPARRCSGDVSSIARCSEPLFSPPLCFNPRSIDRLERRPRVRPPLTHRHAQERDGAGADG